MAQEVPDSVELRRILALPKRDWRDYNGLVEHYTRELKTPAGTMTLKPVQAAALHELVTQRGLFAPIRVGGGKTLVSMLAPLVVGAQRPLLLIPANLRTKTLRDFDTLAHHWRRPPLYRIE